MRAEIEDSSLQNHDKFTICGRFRTPFLPDRIKNMTIQSLLYRTNMWFFNRLDMRDCEDRYEGCTNYYKHKIGKIQKIVDFQFIQHCTAT